MDAKTAAAAAGVQISTLNVWAMRGLLPGLPAGSGGRRRHVTVDVAVHLGVMGALVHLGLGPTVASAFAWGSTDINRLLVEGSGASQWFFKDEAGIAAWVASRVEPLPVYIVVNVEAIRARMQAIEDDPYTIANLRPASTGLPMAVSVSERGNAQHDARVKVCRVHGDTMPFNNTASVAVRPQPHLAAGTLSQADLDAVSRWITLNADPIVEYWDGLIDTVELARRLRPLGREHAPGFRGLGRV